MKFFDTNILLYAVSDQDPRKKIIACDILRHALETNHDGCISVQVLNEFSNALLGKLKTPIEAVDGFLTGYRDLLRSDITMDLVRNAVAIKAEYGIHFYDAVIVATAAKLHCTELYTEDLNDGQVYCGVKVVNPFLEKE